MNPATKLLRRPGEQLARCGALLQDAVLQHGNAVAHGHRLDLIVGDVDGGDAEPALQRGDLCAGLHAELGVEVRQRLVHQEDLRLAHDRPTHGDALTLAARQLGRLAIEEVVEVEQLGRLEHTLVDLGLGHPFDLEVEADVLGDGHVRIQRVALEHHRDVTRSRAAAS